MSGRGSKHVRFKDLNKRRNFDRDLFDYDDDANHFKDGQDMKEEAMRKNIEDCDEYVDVSIKNRLNQIWVRNAFFPNKLRICKWQEASNDSVKNEEKLCTKTSPRTLRKKRDSVLTLKLSDTKWDRRSRHLFKNKHWPGRPSQNWVLQFHKRSHQQPKYMQASLLNLQSKYKSKKLRRNSPLSIHTKAWMGRLVRAVYPGKSSKPITSSVATIWATTLQSSWK